MRFNRGDSARVLPVYFCRVLGYSYLTNLRVTIRPVIPHDNAAHTGGVSPVYLHVVSYRQYTAGQGYCLTLSPQFYCGTYLDS